MVITLQEQQHAAAVAAATKPASQLVQIQEAPVSALPPPERRGADYAAATSVAGSNDTVGFLSAKLQQQQQLKWEEDISCFVRMRSHRQQCPRTSCPSPLCLHIMKPF